jgi:hypothetical protein
MNDKILQLRALAREAKNYQLERGWSDAQTCKEIGQLGSTKTFNRILDEEDPLDELHIDKQLRNYESALELVKALRDQDRIAEPEYEDFTNILDSRSAVQRAVVESTIARFVVVEGENGTGKDAVKNALAEKWKNTVVCVEADEFWRESLAVPIRAILGELSVRRARDEQTGESFRIPRYPADMITLLLEELNKKKITLVINEAHHMGPRGLNIFKSIINKTPTVVVFLCIPRLLTQLVSGAYEEAIQLFGNRLCQRVYLPTPPQDEILLLLSRRGVKFADKLASAHASTKLEAEAPHFGNWRFVNMVCRELVALSRRAPITQIALDEAVNKVKSRRVRKQSNKVTR